MPLAAVSSSGSLIFLFIGFLSGLAVGAGVVIAKFFGARDTANMSLAIHTTVAVGLAASVLMTAVGVVFSPHILVWMDTPPEVMADSVTYLRIYFAGSAGAVMYNILVGILQAVGDSRHPLYYLMASSAVNLVLDLLFIGVLHTGVGGAAVATILSQFVSAGLCLLQLTCTRQSCGFSAPLRFYRRCWGSSCVRPPCGSAKLPSFPLPTSWCSPISMPLEKWPWPAAAPIPKLRASAFCPSPASPWR